MARASSNKMWTVIVKPRLGLAEPYAARAASNSARVAGAFCSRAGAADVASQPAAMRILVLRRCAPSFHEIYPVSYRVVLCLPLAANTASLRTPASPSAPSGRGVQRPDGAHPVLGVNHRLAGVFVLSLLTR
jgi:hypothetical protein